VYRRHLVQAVVAQQEARPNEEQQELQQEL
jgi:hypothetical protein